MHRKTMIKKIKAVINEWGSFNIGELDQPTNSPIVKSIGKHTSVCIDGFNHTTVSTTTYVNDIDTETDEIDYEDLSMDLLKEVYDIVIYTYDVEQYKTFSRCRSENY